MFLNQNCKYIQIVHKFYKFKFSKIKSSRDNFLHLKIIIII